MLVTVAICTWNRADLLDQTLKQMRNLLIPSGVEWELLVVNNNCTDQTDEVLARHEGDLPLRRLLEQNQGLSHARNCATGVAKGELLIWTDDDVLVEPDWLSAYVAASKRWPTAQYFGGLIDPWYEKKPPHWISRDLDRFEGMILIRNLDTQERLLQPREHVFGANMAFRRGVYAERKFDARLGRSGTQNILGEETEFQKDLEAEGIRGVWVPAARIRHFVPAQRITKAYCWSYNQGLGRTRIRLEGAPEGRTLWGAPRWMYRKLWAARLKARWLQLTGSNQWIGEYITAANVSGMIVECRKQLAHRRSAATYVLS